MNTVSWDSQSKKTGSIWERTTTYTQGHTSCFYLHIRDKNINIFLPPTKGEKTLPGAPFEKSQCTQTFTTSAWAQVEKTFPWRGSIGKCQLKKCSSTIACMLLMRVSLSDAFTVIDHIPQWRGQSAFPRRFWAMWGSVQVQTEIKTKQG